MSSSQFPRPQPAAEPERVLFWRPCFGIAVQGSSLTVSVVARPGTPRPPACG